MKQILLFLFLGLSATSFAQQADTTKHTPATDYLKKSKNQKTAGWILLGGGALMTTIGTVVVANDITDELVNIFDPNPPAKKNETLGSVLFYGGLVAVAGSIPLFIAAGKNRRKAAASVSFKMENATNIYQYAVTNARYPAVALQIRL